MKLYRITFKTVYKQAYEIEADDYNEALDAAYDLAYKLPDQHGNAPYGVEFYDSELLDSDCEEGWIYDSE